jgi:hypothetical protein
VTGFLSVSLLIFAECTVLEIVPAVVLAARARQPDATPSGLCRPIGMSLLACCLPRCSARPVAPGKAPG